MSFWQIIGKNLLGFDLIIFFTAMANGLLFYFVRKNTEELYRQLHIVFFIPSHSRNPEEAAYRVTNVDEEKIIDLRKKSESLYTVYVNLTAIFPLLGILGTVVSLLPMVSEMADMQQNFFAALTSTFWGLIFSILFKLLDSLVSPKIEDNDKNVALLLQRREKIMEQEK